jgi:hypothetical protein
MQVDDEARDEEFSECDRAYYGGSSGVCIEELLFAFIKSNRGAIRL